MSGAGVWELSFELVEGKVSGGPAQGFAHVACAGTGSVLQIAGIGADGQLYHTIRNADGTWQGTFGLVKSQVAGGPAQFTQVACAGVGSALHLAGIGADGRLYHTIRNADGTWQGTFGLIEKAVPRGAVVGSVEVIAATAQGTNVDIVLAGPPSTRKRPSAGSPALSGAATGVSGDR
jgi:hypothetical protein